MDSQTSINEIKARPYQDEIVARALEGNVICSLGTGTGKTYIAVKVIEALQEEIRGKWDDGVSKRTVFLVPSVALVHQQSDVLIKMLGIATGAYSGAAGVDEWNKSKWQDEFRKNRILVMTPAILHEQLLATAILDIHRINLIVMDECHHAAEKHPYREIMRSIERFPPGQVRPKILGLTASVINIKMSSSDIHNPGEKIQELIRELERCLDATVWTSYDPSLKHHGARPSGKIEDYQSLYLTKNLVELRDELEDMIDWLAKNNAANRKLTEAMPNGSFPDDGNFDSINISLGKVKNYVGQVVNTLTSLGPWCAYQTAAMLLNDLVLMCNQDCFNQQIIFPVNATIARLHLFGTMLESFYALKPNSFHDLEPLISPKILKLLELLKRHATMVTENNDVGEICGIIFVKERYNAWALYLLLNYIACLPGSDYSFIRAGFCVGGYTSSGSEETAGEKIGLSPRQLKSTLDKFRKGTLNILVATEVVEEGFDMRKCNLIVRFDPPTSYRSYIQSRGRARAKNSHFIMMIDSIEYEKFKNGDFRMFEVIDEQMQKHCFNRQSPTRQERDNHFEDEKYPPFCPGGSAGSGAHIPLSLSISRLQMYCNTLPNACPIYWKVIKTEMQYKCTVHLPLNAAIKDTVSGCAMESDKLAKMVAALKCCELLYDLGELDREHLLPVAEDHWDQDLKDFMGDRQREEVPEKSPRPGTRKRVQHYPKDMPSLLRNSPVAVSSWTYLYALGLTNVAPLPDLSENLFFDDTITLGILVGTELPSLPSWPMFIHGIEFSASLTLVDILQISPEQFEMTRLCHQAIFFEVLNFKNASETLNFVDGSMLAVPMKRNGDNFGIDWTAVERLVSPNGFLPDNWRDEAMRQQRVISADDFRNAVVICHYRNDDKEERYLVVNVRFDLNPLMKIGKGDTTAKHLLDNYEIRLQHENQPLLEVRHCSKRLNFLFVNTPKVSAPIIVAPELCKILPLSASLLEKCRLLPSVFHRIFRLCGLLELYRELKDGTTIGANIPEPHQWKALQYGQHLVASKTASRPFFDSPDNSSASLNLDSNGDVEIELIVPSVSTGVRLTEEPTTTFRNGGFFYQDCQQGRYYANIKRKGGREAVNNYPDLPDVLPRYQMPVPSAVVSRDLLEPPFKLDAGFRASHRAVVFPELNALLTATTTASSNDGGVNLERLETIGDSFLKMTTCIYLFRAYPEYHEGRLSFLKDMQISNSNLYHLAKAKNLPRFVNNQLFDPMTNFLPPGFSVTDAEQSRSVRKMQLIQDKCLADVVEALIGMVLIEASARSALVFMQWIGLKVIPDEVPIPSPLLRGNSCSCGNMMIRLDEFEQHIGYKFRQPGFLLQAFTHNSFYKNRVTDCYQRLEFIGDAILDFLVTRYLYDDPQCHSPGKLTDLRMALVNNRSFAVLAAKNNFHIHTRYCSPKIFGLHKAFVEEIQVDDPNISPMPEDMLCFALGDDDDEEDFGHIDGFEEAEDPKTLGDVFESVAGAIYLDSDCSLDAVWKVYYNLMRERIEFCVNNCPRNPVRELLEQEPGNCRFEKPEIVKGRKVRVFVNVLGKGSFPGIGNNLRAAKCSAAKEALRKLPRVQQVK